MPATLIDAQPVITGASSSSALTARAGEGSLSHHANWSASSVTLALGSNGNGEESKTTSLFLDLEGRDAEEQFALLHEKLVNENRIKDGAEHMLSMKLNDALRFKVVSELEMAKAKIEAITERMGQQSTFRGGSRRRSNGFANAAMGNGSSNNGSSRRSNSTPMSAIARAKEDAYERDDSRSALIQATALMKTLGSLARPAPPQSSSAAPTPDPEEVDKMRIETMSKIMDVLQRNLRVRYELSIAELVGVALPALADRCSRQCRATAYRLIRHCLVDSDSVERLREEPLDWYIVKSLARDNKHAPEREQVIKLIRSIVEIGSAHRSSHTAAGLGKVSLSEPIMRALIAVAEHAEDPFRSICVETLAEILVVDIDLVARTGGVRTLLHILAEGPPELAPILATTFLHIIDLPRTRSYLHIGEDLEMALSAITDAYGKPDHADRMRSCARIIQLMLRTWSGLMYFCTDNMQAIRSIINTLRIPSLENREIILDIFFDLLNIRAPEWFQTFIDGRRLTMYRRSRAETVTPSGLEAAESPPECLKLTDQYLGLLVLVFTECDILQALTCMLEETTMGSNLSRKATLLMAEILQLANRVLPLSLAAKIQALPQIFCLASDYALGEHRIVGTLALSALDSFNRNKTRLQASAVKSSRPRANSVEDAVRRGQRQVEQVKLKMSMQMDDKTFQASLLETQVMLTKDHTKWNFEMLQELIEGPLLNPKRMEEAIKVSRFIRRLLSFFHPFNHRFSDMERVKSNLRWVRLGSSLLTTLISSPDGLRYLSSEDDFLQQIVKGFAQLDPFNGSHESAPIFSKRRVAETLTYGYLEMLGTLSRHQEGVELMERFKIFTAFYHLSELRSREDLIKGIIENLDYNIDGHPRIVLSKTLTSTYKHIRLFATNHLGQLIRNSSNANAWTLRLLLTQLYDPAPEVCRMAVQFLEEACEDMEILQLVVEMQPTMDHLGEIGHPLLMKFMSTPVGFRYLFDAGYIDREIDIWFHERNIYYVVQVEIYLAKFFGHSPLGADDENMTFDSTAPPHFYGEMTKTELGSQVLREKGHFAEFSHFIRRHGLETEDPEVILKLKSILWAVGHIGATEHGLHFLEEEEITPVILEIAEHSPIPSVRGTCYFVLGLISSTFQGSEILCDYGWEGTVSPVGTPTGLCVPTDLQKFITLPTWTVKTVADDVQQRIPPPTSEAELEVLTAIHNLANTVIANAASRTLAKMKSKPEYRPVFTSPTMFYRALHVISTQHYKLPVRRYILDLFNIELNSSSVGAIVEAAKALKSVQNGKTLEKPLAGRVVSIFGRVGRSRRDSVSDEEDELTDANDVRAVADKPVISLRPVSRIVGFDK